MTTVPFDVAEQTEIRAYVRFMADAPKTVREMLGIGFLDIGSALALVVREDPSQFFNRAGGFTTERPADRDLVAEICDFYREKRVPRGAFVIAPPILPADWPQVAAEFDLTEGTRYVKLGCDVDTAVARAADSERTTADLRVSLLERHHAREFATVMMQAIGRTTPGMVEVADACVGRTDWRQYAVWAGNSIIAVGSLFINGDCADMFGGATLPAWRGRGAQTALLAARVCAAQAAGCRWIVADAVAEAAGEHNSSLHNMLRIGFEELYVRPTWVWSA